MNRYPTGSAEDRELLMSMPLEKLLDLFFLQIRNLWRVDGLYFLGIEERFGTEAATAIDAEVWQIMAKIEAKSLKRVFGVGDDASLETILDLLGKSSWALDQPFRTIERDDDCAILTVQRCRTQEARLAKGLDEFPCKEVRMGYLKSFAKALNGSATVACVTCPPDEHSSGPWCEWKFRLQEQVTSPNERLKSSDDQ